MPRPWSLFGGKIYESIFPEPCHEAVNKRTANITALVLVSLILLLGVFIGWKILQRREERVTREDLTKPGIKKKRMTVAGRPHFIPTEVAHPEKIRRRITFTYSTNSHGLRGKEFSAKKEPGVYRIIVAGECVTFGAGVDDHQTYAVVLERLLRIRNPSRRIEVINAGSMAGAPGMVLGRLKQAARYQPDMVLFAPGTSTVSLPSHVGEGRTRIWLRKEEYTGELMRYRAVLQEAMESSQEGGFRLMLITPTMNSFFLPDGMLWLAEMKKFATENGLVVIDTTSLVKKREKQDGLVFEAKNGVQRLVQNRKGVASVLKEVHYAADDNSRHIAPQIYQYLDSHPAVSPLLSIDGNHLNPLGHEVVAGVIARVLRREKVF